MPVVLAPIGMAGMYARRGEVQAARAAKAAGMPSATLSTMSICDLPRWSARPGRRGSSSTCCATAASWTSAAASAPPTLGVPGAGCSPSTWPVPGTRYRDIRKRPGRRSQPGRAAPARAWTALTHPGWLLGRASSTAGRTRFGNVADAVPEAEAASATSGPGSARNFDASLTLGRHRLGARALARPDRDQGRARRRRRPRWRPRPAPTADRLQPRRPPARRRASPHRRPAADRRGGGRRG